MVTRFFQNYYLYAREKKEVKEDRIRLRLVLENDLPIREGSFEKNVSPIL